MNAFVRSSHRWLSVAFMAAVLVNITAQIMGIQAVWIGLLALFPLILMMISGMWLFVLPYMARRRAVRW